MITRDPSLFDLLRSYNRDRKQFWHGMHERAEEEELNSDFRVLAGGYYLPLIRRN